MSFTVTWTDRNGKPRESPAFGTREQAEEFARGLQPLPRYYGSRVVPCVSRVTTTIVPVPTFRDQWGRLEDVPVEMFWAEA